MTFEGCWAMYNGYSTNFESLGDGNGFKAGGFGTLPADRLPESIPRHVVRQCLAVRNKASGFYANHQPGGGDWFNNTAYRNGANFNMLGRLADNRTDVDGFGHTLRNNLSYQGRADLVRFDAAKCDSAANSFDAGVKGGPNGGPKLTDADFASVDEAELIRPRQANGELPVVGFLHPARGSQLIDRGVGVGLKYLGARPDLGAFEFRE